MHCSTYPCRGLITPLVHFEGLEAAWLQSTGTETVRSLFFGQKASSTETSCNGCCTAYTVRLTMLIIVKILCFLRRCSLFWILFLYICPTNRVDYFDALLKMWPSYSKTAEPASGFCQLAKRWKNIYCFSTEPRLLWWSFFFRGYGLEFAYHILLTRIRFFFCSSWSFERRFCLPTFCSVSR